MHTLAHGWDKPEGAEKLGRWDQFMAQQLAYFLDRMAAAEEDIELFELNEAFASQSVAVMRTLELDENRVNVNGGAIALGHPVGASGARVLVTLLHGMNRLGSRHGIATLCVSGGMGLAALVERQSS